MFCTDHLFYPVLTKQIDFGSTSTELAEPISDHFRSIRLVATENCHVSIGVPGLVATTNDMIIAANEPGEVFDVLPGQSVAALRETTDGILYITELTN